MERSLFELVLERNARETTPFVSVYEANASLWKLTDGLQTKLVSAEREIAILRQQLVDASSSSTTGSFGKNITSQAALTAALKNEAKLRDKLEKLSDDYNAKLKAESDIQADALKTAAKLQDVQELNSKQEKAMEDLRNELELAKKSIGKFEIQLKEAEVNRKLAEQQYDGLKSTIRILQEENDALKKDNRELETRLVTEKTIMVEEMSEMTNMVEAMKKEIDMLRTLQAQEEKRRSKSGWFGSGTSTSPDDNSNNQNEASPKGVGHRFGACGVVVPSTVVRTLTAHAREGTCVRYDGTGLGLVASSSADGMVKVWETHTGTLRATLRGTGPNHTITACDISGNLIVGAGSDKTCRVWQLKTERMIHHLVGHQHKITCVRLFNNEKNVITGSADRSLKVWDIARKTYRQTVTLRHSSTANCVDVESETAVTGHHDGGLRFWDLKSGDRTENISEIHENGITSVQFNPRDTTQVLTNSLDSTLKIVDLKTGTIVRVFRHAEFSSCHAWSSSVFSPDGRFVASGSSANGYIFIWNANDGILKAQLKDGHQKVPVVGIDWGRNSEQSVATIDRKGVLVFWS